MRTIILTNQFKRDFKKLRSSGMKNRVVLDQALALLQNDSPLPERLHDHPLSGQWKTIEARDCHIRPDVVLIYSKPPGELRLHRIGSHSELLEK